MAALCKITWILYFSFCGNFCTSMKRNSIILQVVESNVHVQVVGGSSVHVHQLISLVSGLCGHSEHLSARLLTLQFGFSDRTNVH